MPYGPGGSFRLVATRDGGYFNSWLYSLAIRGGRAAGIAEAGSRFGDEGLPGETGGDTVFNHTSFWPTATLGTGVNKAMTSNPTLTKQGVRDLNHYGPKPGKARSGAPKEASGGEVKAVAQASPKGPDASLPVEDGEKRALP